MRRLLPLFVLSVAISSCDVYEPEPRYDARDKVIGQYDIEEYSNTYHETTYYSFYIRKSGYSREIIIDNFYASDIRVYAYLDYNKITIPYQVINGYEIEGTGAVYGNSLSFNYRVRDTYHNSYSDFCETQAWRY